MSDLGLTQPPAAGTDGAATRVVEEKLRLEQRAKNGAGWFFWIAGLSLVNSAVHLTGSDWNFIFGLGITLLFDLAARQIGGAGQMVAFVLSAAVAGMFVLFGLQAQKRRKWAFYAGMALYALDGLIFLLAGDWVGTGVHALALYFIYGGLAAYNQLAEFEARTGSAAIPAS